MSAPTSSATIMFPAKCFDQEIRRLLGKEYDIEFKPQIFGPSREMEIARIYDALEFAVQDGLIVFHNGEARYGEFYELEDLLVKKGIPFDRESSMDYDRPPETRVFRPTNPPFDASIPDDQSSGTLKRLLKAAKAILPHFNNPREGGDPRQRQEQGIAPRLYDAEVLELEAAIKEAESLMPSYAPLRDWKEAMS